MANVFKEDFAKWAIEKSGFWGGDIGSRDRRSIWICGIEEGGDYGDNTLSEESLKKRIKKDLNILSCGGTLGLGYKNNYYSVYMNSRDFDKGVLKLINAFIGYNIKDYKSDNWEDYKKKLPLKPFVENYQKRFFKMNLFPVASSNENQWNEHVQNITGFNSKEDFRKWCRGSLDSKNRFAEIRNWVECYRPKLIICFGRNYVKDFKKAFLTDIKESVEPILICGRKLEIYKDNSIDLVVAICPFPTWRGKNALNPNNDDLIQHFGDKIKSEFDRLSSNADA